MVVNLASPAASDTISAVSDGVGGTWTECVGCAVTDTVGALGSLDVAYIVGGPGGATSISVTDSLGNIRFVAVSEFVCTANCTGLAVDQVPSTFGDNASCGTCTMTAYSGLTAGSLVVNTLNFNGAVPTSPSTGYVVTSSFVFAYNLAASSGTAGTVVQSPSGNFLSSGISFR